MVKGILPLQENEVTERMNRKQKVLIAAKNDNKQRCTPECNRRW